MLYLKKGFQHLVEWMLCCPMEDEEQFDANLEELYTVLMPISLLSVAAGSLLFLFVHFFC
ncbi:MAG: hypothetical protein IJ452_08675 [Butyricicoccus sp.]|nr:hypothetical protein [Butyricicoccus sp.]MBQ8586337.1 hypothetical protein [Butyricicoccus sp.]